MRDASIDRRADQRKSSVVEDGLAIERERGRGAAMGFMIARGIPRHIALRVLSCSAFRRKRVAPGVVVTM